MNRRQFLLAAAGTAGAVVLGSNRSSAAAAAAEPAPATQPAGPSASHLPRWRGFNLLEKFVAEQSGPYRESDFAWIAEWGFNFVRLPMSYRCWADAADWLTLREPPLKEVDAAVEMGRRHGIHVNLNLHRAPGYCVNPPKEPLDLWTDEKALDACAFHWAHLAGRYKGIPSERVSFDLLNEPADLPVAQYVHVVGRLVEAIRAVDPDRLISGDGLRWGTRPVPELAPLGIAQSTRGYTPMRVSHYKAGWVAGSDTWPPPAWPLTVKPGDVWDKDRLRREQIEPWKNLEARGVGVHVGEWGAWRETPHDVALKWMGDCLALWREAGWGWSLWNFRGGFGVLDSGRTDVATEDFRGHKLDRAMLELLRAN